MDEDTLEKLRDDARLEEDRYREERRIPPDRLRLPYEDDEEPFEFDQAALLRLHSDICEQCRSIMEAKNTDYTAGGSVFANFDLAETLGIPREMGVLLRVQDKMQRLRSFIDSGTLAVKSESAEDAIMDVINYMVLLAGMLEEDRNEG